MNTADFLLRTVHGSTLYGLNHANSDLDTYMVVANGKKRAMQKIVGKDDITVLTLGEFARQIHKGAPQALEALFSPIAERANLDAYRQNFYPDTALTVNTYRRTINGFALTGTLKGRRHALRLARNLRDLLEHGRFNPRLDAADRDCLTKIADSSPQEYMDFLLDYSPTDPFDGESAEYMEELIRTW